MATQIEEVHYETPPLWVCLLESTVLTLLIPVIGLLLHPGDPLFYASTFSWLVAAPLLVGLRYGFLFGFGSALATVAIMALGPRLGLAEGAMPLQYAIGVVLTGMVAGEFTDVWKRRFVQMRIINDYQNTRLAEFVRNYHVLRVSHDQLAERLAANPHNIRDSLLELAERFHIVEPSADVLMTQAPDVLAFLAAEGRLQQCAIFAVDSDHKVDARALDFFGGQPADKDIAEHPMVAACIKQRCMVALKSEMAGELQSQSQPLLAVIPLVDIDERIWAVVTVTEMPFVVFERGNLHLLAVLGGSLGDIIGEAYERSPTDRELARQQFEHRLRRWTQYAKRYNLNSVLIAYQIPGHLTGLNPDLLIDLVFEQLRALDFAWVSDLGGGTRIMYVLMPLTPERGAAPYRERMTRMLQERYGMDVASSGLEFHQRFVDGGRSAAETLDDIRSQAESHARS